MERIVSLSSLRSSKDHQDALRLAWFAGAAFALALGFFGFSSHRLSTKAHSLDEGRRLLVAVKSFQESRGIDFGKSFYASDHPADFVGEILEWVNRHHLKLVAIKPEERAMHKRPGATFSGDALSLRVKGSFGRMYQFLIYLETGPLFLIEDSFILEKVDEENVELSLRFILPVSPQGMAP